MPGKPIDTVCILCTARDLWLARISAASVRYWSPDVPILLVKDPVHGPFDTTEIERASGATSIETLARPCGWGFGKIELLFRFPGRRLFLLDADTVLCGDVVAALNGEGADFVVSEEQIDKARFEELQRYYFQFDAMRALDPGFTRPRFLFTAGHIVGTSGVLSKEDFDPWLRWTSPIEHRYPDVFIAGDQGVLNYVLGRAEREGRATVATRHFAILAATPEVSRVDLEKIRRRTSEPFLVHYNGPKPPLLVQYPRHELLAFFERLHYARVPGGRWIRAGRLAATLGAAAARFLRSHRPIASRSARASASPG